MDDHDHHVGVRLTAIALEADAAVGAGHVVEKLLGVLADERLLVVTRDVVPSDAVIVHVVQDSQARLGSAVDVVLGIVRLPGLLVASLRPRVERPACRCLVGGCHFLAICRPEPAVQRLGLEITTVLATLKVAETSGCPDVWNIV